MEIEGEKKQRLCSIDVSPTPFPAGSSWRVLLHAWLRSSVGKVQEGAAKRRHLTQHKLPFVPAWMLLKEVAWGCLFISLGRACPPKHRDFLILLVSVLFAESCCCPFQIGALITTHASLQSRSCHQCRDVPTYVVKEATAEYEYFYFILSKARILLSQSIIQSTLCPPRAESQAVPGRATSRQVRASCKPEPGA